MAPNAYKFPLTFYFSVGCWCFSPETLFLKIDASKLCWLVTVWSNTIGNNNTVIYNSKWLRIVALSHSLKLMATRLTFLLRLFWTRAKNVIIFMAFYKLHFICAMFSNVITPKFEQKCFNQKHFQLVITTDQ